MTATIRFPRLIASILLCEAAGGVGAIATRGAIESWYRDLRKPAFTPPGSLFGPVWTALYLLMGVALYVISQREDRRAVRVAQGVFGTQLALNAAWPFLFFARRSPRAALVEVVMLWFAIVVTIIVFSRLSKLAALLLVPYLLWTTFATMLNFSIWRLND